MAQPASSDPVQTLREEFRQHLEVFYARLKLAPPYDSVEKAIARLTAKVKALSVDEQQRLLADVPARWQAYRAAFVESGLHLKHRGIIAGLARKGQTTGLPDEHRAFLEVFLSKP
jgi:hypothetical protein